MINRQLLRPLAAVALGAGLAFAAPALPAVGQLSPPTIVSIDVGEEATLVAKGAAVLVPVEVVCPAGSMFASLSVQVTQRVGNRIASGFGVAEVVCTGGPQTVNVLVTAEGQAFKKGPAVAEVSLFACNQFGCRSVNEFEEIRIERDR